MQKQFHGHNEKESAELLTVNDIKHLSLVLVTTQPAAKTVEIAKEVHPVEKAMVFDKPPDKKN